MSERYTNIRIIMDKLLRNPLLSDLTLETVVDYTVDFMRIVGVPRMFIDKVCNITISGYKGSLPEDWVDTIQVKLPERAFLYTTDNFHMEIPQQTNNPITVELGPLLILDEDNNPILMNNPNVDHLMLIENYKTLPPIPEETSVENKTTSNLLTFKIQGGIIVTSIESGEITMAYRAIAVDEEGFPMLPDNSKFTRALESYIKLQHFNILFDLGRINQVVYNNAYQQYAFNVGACENEFKKLDISMAESFFNSYRNLMPRTTEFDTGFIYNARRG